MAVTVIENINDMQRYSLNARHEGRAVALVPTMGYLHAGHASLMEEGRRRSDLLVASIFVNPAQFGVGEDFEKYPRDMEGDIRIAAAAGVDVIFAPAAAAMYPAGYQTYVDVETADSAAVRGEPAGTFPRGNHGGLQAFRDCPAAPGAVRQERLSTTGGYPEDGR